MGKGKKKGKGKRQDDDWPADGDAGNGKTGAAVAASVIREAAYVQAVHEPPARSADVTPFCERAGRCSR